MGVGIMFCANEIQMLSSAAAQIQYGQKPDPAIQAIINFFPPSYTTFEVLIMLRLVFFLVFSVINAFSLTFNQDDAKERASKSDLVRKKMLELTQLCEQIYQTVTCDKLNIKYELKKREYQMFRNTQMKEIDQTHKAYQAGKTVEDLKKPSKFSKAKAWILRALLFIFIIRVAVPKEHIASVKAYFSG